MQKRAYHLLLILSLAGAQNLFQYDVCQASEDPLLLPYNQDILKHQTDSEAALFEQILHAGGRMAKFAFHTFDNGIRGAIALEDIPKKTLVLYVPIDMCITQRHFGESPTLQKLEELGVELDYTYDQYKHLLMAIYILDESRKPESKWSVYLQSLPESFDEFPLLYSESELQQLKGSHLGRSMEVRIPSLKSSYEKIRAAVPEFNFSFQELLIAYNKVSSRNFGTNQEEQPIALSPLSDMFNHVIKFNTAWQFREDGHYFWAYRDIAKGEEITDSYGDESNIELLAGYGFLIPDNPNRTPIYLMHDLDKKDPLFKIKSGVIAQKVRFEFTVGTQNTEALSLMRLVFFDQYDGTPTEFREFMSQFRNSQEVPAISYDNERRVLTQITRLCRSQLQGYIQTYMQDQISLEGDLTLNMRNIIEYTREEKSQIIKVLNWAEQTLELFDMELSEAIDMIKGYEGYAPYRKEVLLPLFEKEASN